MDIQDLEIDEEFQSLIRPLTEEEKLQLRGNIESVGRITDPIKVWKGTEIVLDGHHRFEISEAANFRYQAPIEFVELKDREEAKLWIVRNQLGRRNIDYMDRARFTAILIEASSEPTKKEAVAKVAEQTNSSERTVYRDLETQQMIEDLPHRVRKKLESGKIASSVSALKALNTLPPDQKMQAMDLIEHATEDEMEQAVNSVSDAVNIVKKYAVEGDSKKSSDVIATEKFMEAFLGKAPRLLDDRATFYGDDKLGFRDQCQAALKQLGKHWREWLKAHE